jgi:hypothetical protein
MAALESDGDGDALEKQFNEGKEQVDEMVRKNNREKSTRRGEERGRSWR